MTTPTQLWQSPPPHFTLSSTDVHVWRASLVPTASKLARCEPLLTADERDRAQRFYARKHRDHYTIGRGILRILLGHYLGKAPEALRFTYNDYGKPELASPSDAAAIRFNLSHSRDAVLYAMTRRYRIGIDIEYIRADMELERIAERFFSASEVTVLRALAIRQQPRGFFNCWTRKEAFIKAVGSGLSYPLDQFDVSLRPGEPAALLHIHNAPADTAQWALHDLDPGPGYAAALAVEGRDWHLSCWQWADEDLTP